jgi:hypothetical protein
MKLVMIPLPRRGVVDQQWVDSAVLELGRRSGIEVVTVEEQVTVLRPSRPQHGLLGFEPTSHRSPEDRETRLKELRGAAAGATGGVVWQDPAWNSITTIADADAVLLVGAAESPFTQSEDAYELLGLVEIAGIFGKPVVLAGFKFPYRLAGRGSEVVAEALRSAALVGVVDQNSHDWAIRHGVPRARVRRSPLGLGLTSSLAISTAFDDDALPNPYVVADFGQLTDIDLYASAISQIAERLTASTGLPTVLMEPGSAEGPGSSALATGASLLLSTDSPTLRLAAHHAVPVIGIGADERFMSAVAGGMERVGMAEWAVAAASLGSGDLTQLVEETWARRAEIRAHLQSIANREAASSLRWWDDVASLLEGKEVPSPRTRKTEEVLLRDRQLATRITFARDVSRGTHERHATELLGLRNLVDELGGTVSELHRAELRIGELHAELLDAETRAQESDAGLAAAHTLMAEIAEPVFARALRPPMVPYSENALNDLLQSRTMRWSTRIRALYDKLPRLPR